MPRGARWIVAAVALAGAGAGLLLFSTFRDPCRGLLRRYAAAYDAAKSPCQADADCVLDPAPPAGPATCDRARASASARRPLEALEARWSERGCPAAGAACPAIAGAACRDGRCVTVLR